MCVGTEPCAFVCEKERDSEGVLLHYLMLRWQLTLLSKNVYHCEKTSTSLHTVRQSNTETSSFSLSAPSSGRNGQLRILSFKTGLVCLCNADIQEKCKCKMCFVTVYDAFPINRTEKCRLCPICPV